MTEKMFTVTLNLSAETLARFEWYYEVTSSNNPMKKLLKCIIKQAYEQLENVNGVDWL